MGVYWAHDDKAKITLFYHRNPFLLTVSASRSLQDHSEDIGRLVVLPAWCCFVWGGDALSWINIVNKKGAREDLFTQIQTLSSFLPLSPKFDVISSYTCHFPGIWAAARTPSGCCQSGSRYLCRSGFNWRECCPYRYSIRSPLLSEQGIIFHPPLPSGWEKANIS